MSWLRQTYETLVLDRPAITLALVFLVSLLLGFHAPKFRLDASSDSLVLENDQALKYYRAIKARYGSDDYLVVTYTPKADLFAQETLSDLSVLKNSLVSLESVDSVFSILDVPLIQSPPITIEELDEKIPVLRDPDMDINLARKELLSSPFYKDLLISDDGETTALFVNFHVDDTLRRLLDEREKLREQALEADLTKAEKKKLLLAEKAYSDTSAKFQRQQQDNIAAVRDVLAQHTDQAKIHLGGIPMIVTDSIDFISKDLRTFGFGVLALLVGLLILIFRRKRWVFLSILTCSSVGLGVTGLLGLLEWPVTVVSANFISLLLIFTLSFCVHQIVRYRECRAAKPKANQRELVWEMVRTIGKPCFYMVFTTMVAFGSLVVSDIRPIIDFGWLMAIGLGFSFVLSFTLFPAALMFFEPVPPLTRYDLTGKITAFFARFTRRYSKILMFGFVVILGLSAWGTSQLYVQNSFINYYKKNTDIYQGMVTIDTKLGGTTPLDVIIDAPQSFLEARQEEAEYLAEEGLDFGTEGPEIAEGYWFGHNFLDDIAAIHNYLDGLPETGKVLSFHTTIELLQSLKYAKPLDRFYLGVLYTKTPDDIKDLLFKPYISDDGNQLRFSIRVFESMEKLDRQKLLEKIYHHLTKDLGLKSDQVHTTGMVVLYNNVLQSLFQSQILTVWVVFITMFVVFLFLFKNIKIAAVAIIPNITVTAMVLGVMGWLDIPLDIMTITIAAICFGTADDNTIHYTHRVLKEFEQDKNYWNAIDRSHTTIGRAMYYTGITVILGFSILAFSNFVPTIYFGLLIGFSMLVALLANLVLLPLLIALFKPFGKDVYETNERRHV